MFRAIGLQIGATVIVVVLASMLVGVRGGVSAGLGGFACILPNLMFALRLASVSKRPGGSYPLNFFIGEFVKIAATIGLLAIAVRSYPEMHWLSMLAGMVIALQAGFFALGKKS